jgi:hypothetical protein
MNQNMIAMLKNMITMAMTKIWTVTTATIAANMMTISQSHKERDVVNHIENHQEDH